MRASPAGVCDRPTGTRTQTVRFYCIFSQLLFQSALIFLCGCPSCLYAKHAALGSRGGSSGGGGGSTERTTITSRISTSTITSTITAGNMGAVAAAVSSSVSSSTSTASTNACNSGGGSSASSGSSSSNSTATASSRRVSHGRSCSRTNADDAPGRKRAQPQSACGGGFADLPAGTRRPVYVWVLGQGGGIGGDRLPRPKV
ncbi:unnamed protein product [Scytosiphon promiscuus]